MQKVPFLINLFLIIITFSLKAQDPDSGMPFRVVLLGDYQCNACEWTSDDSAVSIIKASVPDFSSQQLSWTVESLVIKPLRGEGDNQPCLCILNTGQLDVVLGVPRRRVIENIEGIREKLKNHNIGFAVMAPLRFTSESVFNDELDSLDRDIRNYCDSTGTDYIDPNTVLSPGGILSAEYTSEGYLINNTGCNHWIKIVNDFIARYDKEQ